MVQKAVVQPMYFMETNEREREEYRVQLDCLKKLYGDDAIFLDPLPVGEGCRKEADFLLFGQLIGAVYSHKDDLRGYGVPVLIMTSQFGTVEMWDWEIAAYLREEVGIRVFTPYSREMGLVILRAAAARRQMKQGVKFLLFQDEPGEGKQAYIFKRFYWWEDECRRQIEEAFGVRIVYKSYKKLNERAGEIPREQAAALWEERKVPMEGVPEEAVLGAVRLYLAIQEEIRKEGNVAGVGSNCLNESFLSDTTPCLAWNWCFEYDHILWACEGDLISLISEYIFYTALHVPVMMTNIYPFLVGMAALKHERIEEFPDIEDPDNHALGVHCGYAGFAPQSFSSSWIMRPKVLEIVDERAVVIDCRMQCGPVTLAKLHADMKKITVIEAEIEDYVQYPGSDCLNGILLKYKNGNGHRVMESLSSHHAVIILGNVTVKIGQIAGIYGLSMEVI